jgi:hypothetical protein
MFMDHMHRLMQMLRLPLFEKKNAVITSKKCVSSATDVTRALVAMSAILLRGSMAITNMRRRRVPPCQRLRP